LTTRALESTEGTRTVPRRAFSDRVEWWTLWLLGLSGGVVLIEPSPYELLMGGAICMLLMSGARLAPSGVFMLGLLALFNLGGVLSLVPFLHDTAAVMFIAVSVYLAVSSGFYAMLVQERTQTRLHALKWGCIGALASTAGILGYFDVAGLSGIFTLHDRASGTFKDPNVLGAFVILPAVFLIQEILASGRLRLRTLLPLALILFGGVFLSFSRGAWGHFAGSTAMMLVLSFLFVAGPRMRLRIVLLSFAGAVVLVTALAVILSIDEVSTMFQERAQLTQSYDAGTTGRFGRQLLAVPELLDRPNGYGPLQFWRFWGEDPHSVYLNAFSSYGWLGGLAYLTLIGATLVIGWRTVLTSSPVQAFSIAVWSTLFVQILIGFIIDTDHWRHFYMMLGLIWGLHAISGSDENRSAGGANGR
jgi:hypothetical protein